MDATPGSAEHRKFYAWFAQAAYGSKNHENIPEGWFLDSNHSNRNRTLFRNDDAKRLIYSFRGTDVMDPKTRWQDLATDAALALGVGKLTDRFKNAKSHTKRVIKNYPDYALTLTGHSLGGSTAAHVHKQVKNTNFVGYSTHVPTSQIQRELTNSVIEKVLDTPKRNGSTTYYTTAADPIGIGAALAYSKYTHVVPQSSKSPHGLINFL